LCHGVTLCADEKMLSNVVNDHLIVFFHILGSSREPGRMCAEAQPLQCLM
jgi:hypothetical protein